LKVKPLLKPAPRLPQTRLKPLPEQGQQRIVNHGKQGGGMRLENYFPRHSNGSPPQTGTALSGHRF
jgi:hypothetical protein